MSHPNQNDADMFQPYVDNYVLRFWIAKNAKGVQHFSFNSHLKFKNACEEHVVSTEDGVGPTDHVFDEKFLCITAVRGLLCARRSQ